MSRTIAAWPDPCHSTGTWTDDVIDFCPSSQLAGGHGSDTDRRNGISTGPGDHLAERHVGRQRVHEPAGRGPLPRLGSQEPGDLYATIRLVTPPVTTDADKESYQAMAKSFAAFNPRANV
ncbi:MAG: hypothetical protein EBW95_00165 [Burkholderiaceae bacterium]|nr:hypothetical protein [Burkholderiaceae bacterium]